VKSSLPSGCLLLPSPYAIEETFSTAKGQKRGEVKRVVAWFCGGRFGHSANVGKVPEQCTAAIECVAVNAGDGFKVVDALEVEHLLWLHSAAERGLQQRQAIGPMSEGAAWIKDMLARLVELCEQLTADDSVFRLCWAQHREEIVKGLNWPREDELPHTITTAIHTFAAVFQLKARISELLPLWASQEKPPMSIDVQAFALRISRMAFHAGSLVHALESMVASYRTLATLGAAKNVKRTMGARALFFLSNIEQLRQQTGREPSTLDLMRHLDGKKDPQTREVIWYGTDKDGTPVIRWSALKKDCKTKKRFASMLSDIKKRARNENSQK